jgi:DNA-binding response OmpR family regulator
MRGLSLARIVVVAADPAHRNFLCAALATLGLRRVTPASGLDEARRVDASPDLCVVDPRQLVSATPRIPNNPFDPARTPGILLASDPSHDTVKVAVASGYSAVVGVPVAPRLLYRRIGSILQKVRRAERRYGRTLSVETAATAEIQES